MTFLGRYSAIALLLLACGLAGRVSAQERGSGPLARPVTAKREVMVVPAEISSPESRPLPGRKRETPAGARGEGTLPSWGSSLGGLVVVLGIALAAAWTLKRMQPAGALRLPAEVVDSLGRAPLAGGQMHLVRCGSQLLLVSVTSQGARTLAEITDPAEVDRLTELCRPTVKAKEAPRA